MSVYALEGLPGSGKTLYVISKIIAPFLTARNAAGEYTPTHIYHNIEGLQPEILCSILGVPASFVSTYFHKLGQKLEEDGVITESVDLVRYFYYRPESIEWGVEIEDKKQVRVVKSAVMIEEGSLIIIDEAQNYFGSRNFAQRYSADVIHYLSRHRHYKHTIWYITQNLDSVDITFRRQTQYVYKLERLENYGRKNSAVVKQYEGWMLQGVDPYAKHTFNYPSKFYAAYQSYQAGSHAEVQEKRYSTNIFLHHKGFMAVVIILAICLMLIFLGGNPFSKSTKTFKKGSTTATPPATAPFKGFSPLGVVEGGFSSSAVAGDSLAVCIDGVFVLGGVAYYQRAGVSYPQEKGVKYALCN